MMSRVIVNSGVKKVVRNGFSLSKAKTNVNIKF